MRASREKMPALVAACALAFAAVCSAGPMGMKVSPGGALIQGVSPGEPVELSFPLTVMNDDEQSHSVVFAALQPSKSKLNLPTGYADIPDVSWVRFSSPEVSVPAKGRAAVRMTLAVPKGDEYRDQHWSVTVAVRSKPAPNQTIALALYPRFEIETVPSDAAHGRPTLSQTGTLQGAVTVTPSVAVFGPRAGSKAAQLAVSNATGKSWQGEVVLIADADAAKKERLDLSSGRQWLPDARWVTLSATTLEIPDGGTRTLVVSLNTPSDAGGRGRSSEAILLFRGRDAPGALARLRFDVAAQR